MVHTVSRLQIQLSNPNCQRSFLIFSFRISITTKIKTLKFSILHFVFFSHPNKHLHTLNNLLDMATGYANCSLGCDDLQHILNHPITIKSVMRIAPGIKTPIAKSLLLGSIFGCFCAFLAFFCLFGYLCPFLDLSSFHSLAQF